MNAEQTLIEQAKVRYFDFLQLCMAPDGTFRLTPKADASAFATCFWIYGMHLLRQDAALAAKRDELSQTLRCAVRETRGGHHARGQLQSKAYRQLLAFTLSALTILKCLDDDPLEDLVTEQLPSSAQSLAQDLQALGCLDGIAQSGNQAMFLAVFLLHARDYLGVNVDERIQAWVAQHTQHLNQFGFWGNASSMTALQFQNGYHQYEIFEYLQIHTSKEEHSALAVASLADEQGHFAPYPGGGGCYDYDAVFMLTPAGNIPLPSLHSLLKLTMQTILSEQRNDGGFAESLYVRPRSIANTVRFIKHIAAARGNSALLKERLRYGIALQRPKHDRIHTHWGKYSRRWNESDLWDSWFRMMVLARIDVAFNPSHGDRWGFINYPGIGYHPCLAQQLNLAKTESKQAMHAESAEA